MASQLSLGEVEANALNTIGLARIGMDDYEGLADLDESLRLVLEHGSPFEIGRVYNNVAFAFEAAGRVERASELTLAALENAERFGQETRWTKAGVAMDDFWRGRWDEAARRADEWLEDDVTNINTPLVRSVRARIRLARDDVTGASEDCAQALQIFDDTRNVIVDEWIGVICVCAQVALAEGREKDALDLVERVSVEGAATSGNSTPARMHPQWSS